VSLRIDMADLEFLSGIYVESRYPLDVGLLPHGEPAKQDAQKATPCSNLRYYTGLKPRTTFLNFALSFCILIFAF